MDNQTYWNYSLTLRLLFLHYAAKNLSGSTIDLNCNWITSSVFQNLNSSVLLNDTFSYVCHMNCMFLCCQCPYIYYKFLFIVLRFFLWYFFLFAIKITQTITIYLQLAGYNEQILDAVFVGHKDSHLAVATNSSQLRIYDSANLSCHLLHGHTALILAVARHSTHCNIFATRCVPFSLLCLVMELEVGI